MNILENKKIAIVGGGPGGLTLARLLQIKGADVKVYERDLHKDARAQGATLDLHDESGLAALREAGLMDAFKANYRPGAELVRIIDKYATIIAEDLPTPEEEIGRPEIDRGPLQRILLDSLQPGTVEGSVYHSEIASPQMHKLLNGGKIFAFGDSKTLIVSSKGDGSLVFYTGIKAGEDWAKDCGIDFGDKNQVLDWFKAEYEGWDSVWQELFENAAVPFVTRPIYCMPLDQTWEALPNMTLIGDAAHLMPPFAGEGVNMAMLDALELSEYLTGGDFNDLQSAIATYEKQMRERASATAQDSLDSGEMLHSPGAIFFMQHIAGMGDRPEAL